MHPERINVGAWLTALAVVSLLSFARCGSFAMDPAMAAAEGEDFTLILRESGGRPSNGYLFLRKWVGNTVNANLEIVTPRALECDREYCGIFRVYGKDGTVVASQGFPRGADRLTIPFRQILNSDRIAEESEGEYQVWGRIYFFDPSGNERSLIARGIIRIVVLRPGYVSLSCDDPHVAWSLAITPQCRAQYSTAGRAVLCGECT